MNDDGVPTCLSLIMAETVHVPVLLRESLEQLRIYPEAVVVDATLGGGGHALRMLEAIGPKGRFFGCDADEEAVYRFRDRIERDSRYAERLSDGRIELVHIPLLKIGDALRDRGALEVSAVLADFGLSSDQLENAERGFSFSREGPLDMRFDRSGGIRASDIVNGSSVSELTRIFREYGDVREAGKIARAIVRQRSKKIFVTTTELACCIAQVVSDRKTSLHPATAVFQAIRIAVNREFESITLFLEDMIGLLRKGGRIVSISFHSGEDRQVKDVFRRDARGCICPNEFPVCRCGRKPRIKVITTRPIAPSVEEISRNSRARSARLRAAERI